MALQPAMPLVLALALTLASGCLAGPSPDPAPDAVLPTDEGAGSSQDAATPVAPQPCTSNSNNYGVSTTVGRLYLVSGRGGNLWVVYEESNGKGNLQTEEECATPDTKIAEVPGPLLGGWLALNA